MGGRHNLDVTALDCGAMSSSPVPEYLEIHDGYCRYCPCGEFSLVVAVEMVSAAIAYCRDRKIHRLLVVMTNLTGYGNPTREDRFWLAQDWVDAGSRVVAVAVVARPEFIDPKRFGVTAAADAGGIGEVFTSEADALRWLMTVGLGDGSEIG
jgi:hypothetical protein